MNIRTHRTRWTRTCDFVCNFFHYWVVKEMTVAQAWELAGRTI